MVHQHHRHLHQARDFGTFLDDLGNAVGLGSSNDKAEKREGSTIYVYQTMPKTFTEGVAGYSTSLPNGVPTSILVDASTPTPTPTPTPKSKSAASKHSTTAEAKTTAKTALAGLPSSIVPSSTLDTSNSEVLLASQTEATSETTTPTPTISPSTTPTAIPSSTPSSGMISGAKAGLAIGIIVVIGAILSLIFFCFRQRKKAEERERLDDEKFTNVPPPAAAAAGGPASMRGLKRLSTAPRLDVRPTTAFFMPNRASQMQNPNAAAAAGNGIQMTSQNRGPAMEQNRANPFGNHAEAIDPVNAAGPSIVDGVSAAGVVVAGAAASARGPVRSTSRGAQNKYAGNKAAQSPFSDAARTDGNRGAQNTSQQMHNTGVMPQPLSGVIEESSASGPVSPTAAAVVVGAASDTNLYRVHLDFSPSMPDELKVRGGEIVKLLKEFDDGWVSSFFLVYFPPFFPISPIFPSQLFPPLSPFPTLTLTFKPQPRDRTLLTPTVHVHQRRRLRRGRPPPHLHLQLPHRRPPLPIQQIHPRPLPEQPAPPLSSERL